MRGRVVGERHVTLHHMNKSRLPLSLSLSVSARGSVHTHTGLVGVTEEHKIYLYLSIFVSCMLAHQWCRGTSKTSPLPQHKRTPLQGRSSPFWQVQQALL